MKVIYNNTISEFKDVQLGECFLLENTKAPLFIKCSTSIVSPEDENNHSAINLETGIPLLCRADDKVNIVKCASITVNIEL